MTMELINRTSRCVWSPTNDWYKHLCDLKVMVDSKTYYLHFAMINHGTNLFKVGGALNIVKVMNSIVAKPYDFEEVLMFIYNGYCNITKQNALPIIKLAVRMKVKGLYKKALRVYEEGIAIDNVTDGWTFSVENSLKDMTILTMSYMMRNITTVSCDAHFLDIDLEHFDTILKSNELNYSNELHVFDLMMKWLDKDTESRSKYISMLIRNIRFERIALDDLVRKVYCDKRIFYNDRIKNYIKKEFLCITNRNVFLNKGMSQVIPNNLKCIRPRITSQLVVTLGGWHGSQPLDLMECFDAHTNEWYDIPFTPSLPNRAYHGLVIIGTKIYMLGGLDALETQLSSVVVVDITTRSWKLAPAMITTRCFTSAALCAGDIYVMGGICDTVRLNRVDKLDMRIMRWSTVAPMNLKRSDACCTTVNDIIYVAGGFTGGSCLDGLESYDPVTNVWTILNPMNHARSGISMVNVDNCIYVVGGYNGIDRLSICERYDIVSNMWKTRCEMKYPRSNCASFILDEQLHVIGGYDGNGTTSYVERYNKTDNTWTELSKLDVSKSALKACVIENFDHVSAYTYYGNCTRRTELRNKYIEDIILASKTETTYFGADK